MIKRIRGMFTRLKALLIAALMATIFPALRIGGTPGGDPPAGDPPAAPPVKTPEQRIAELEGELAGRGARISDLEKEAKEVNKLAITKLAEIDGNLKKTLTGYKALIVAANPDVLPELISGETIEALDNSLANGKELTNKVKTNLEAQGQKKRIPAGAPARGPEDTSGLSAREKISRGITRQ
jgi:hypothetical protein